MKKDKVLHNVTYYNYEIKDHPIQPLVSELFGYDNLENVHNFLDEKALERIREKLFSNETDDQTIFHSIFYKKLNGGWEDFSNAYIGLVKSIMENIYGSDSLIYQTNPTFRVQLPNNIAVGGNPDDSDEYFGFHRDSDEEYNHPAFEKNFIIPLTNSAETQSVYIETFPNSFKFSPAIMKVGQIFNFNGSECLHGNKPNETNVSRVSLDFRVVLPSDYSESEPKNSKLKRKKFVIGDYYDIIKVGS